ncbi:tyrosine-type recombinase/integrase [Pseudomonas qingdaonensis]|uniref:tyrosine-type recombinase/integrase n=1 Tax=Pseudomonas qingdaonensis TaxID=2056231 RepID=UPI000C28AE03|nr:site-specific integrase [Pseudomonas qingdaonensis]
MPVKPRGRGFEATVNHQGGKYRRQFTTQVEAEAWEKATKAALMRGEMVSETTNSANGNPSTLKELADLTYKRFWQGRPGGETALRNAKQCINILGEGMSPGSVNEQRIDDMVFALEQLGLFDSTINRKLSALSKMLTFAYERGYISRKPKIERKKEPQNRIRYFDEAEEQLILGTFTHFGMLDMVDFCIVAIDTGMRVGEILRIEDRDVANGLVSVWRTKNGKARSIPMTKRVAEVLERRFKEERRRKNTIGNVKAFEGWNHSKIRTLWDRVRRHLKLMTDPQFVPHAMRHTFCSRLVQRGVDIVTVSKLAGHSSIVVTMRYAHLAPDSLAHAIRKLEEPAKDVNPQARHTTQVVSQ